MGSCDPDHVPEAAPSGALVAAMHRLVMQPNNHRSSSPTTVPGRVSDPSFNFTVTGPLGGRIVKIEQTLITLEDDQRIVLRTSANKPVALIDHEWPERLAETVRRRMGVRSGEKKGRVLIIWLDRAGRPIKPLAVCSWHVHAGDWPLAILDAGVANAVPEPQAKLFRQVFVAALGQLAGEPKFKDTKVLRPQDRVLWRVDHAPPGPNRTNRLARARAAATRGQRDFAAKKLLRPDRPSWALDGFLGRIEVEPVDWPDSS